MYNLHWQQEKKTRNSLKMSYFYIFHIRYDEMLKKKNKNMEGKIPTNRKLKEQEIEFILENKIKEIYVNICN